MVHNMVYVLVPKYLVENKEKVAEYVHRSLSNEGFVDDGSKLFTTSPADWFVIGGRYSGILTKIRLDPEKFSDYDEFLVAEIEKSKNDEAFVKSVTKAWKTFFPEYSHLTPIFLREPYLELGYPDDVQEVDEVIYEKIIEREMSIYGTIFGTNIYESGTILNLYGIDENEPMIGNFWIVVVDFHY